MTIFNNWETLINRKFVQGKGIENWTANQKKRFRTNERLIMIKKTNIIFSNLYGSDDPFIASAIKRGDWVNTKKILKNGKQKIIDIISIAKLKSKESL